MPRAGSIFTGQGEKAMNEKTLQLIKEKNQKYLSALVGKELPEKLVKQLEELDWSVLEYIHGK